MSPWMEPWPTDVGGYYLFFGSADGDDPYPVVVRVSRSANGVLVWVARGRLLDPDVDRGMFRMLDASWPSLASIRPPGRAVLEASA